MSFAIFKGESSLQDLVSRLFGISGAGSQAKSNQAAKALLNANPQLKDLSKLTPGSVINVPSTAPPLKPSEQATALQVDRTAIAAQAQQTLDAISQHLAEMEARASDSANAFVVQVQLEQVQTLVEAAPQLKQALPNLVSDTVSMVSAAKTSQASRGQALSSMKASVLLFAKGVQSKA
jgi:hypothetical protein